MKLIQSSRMRRSPLIHGGGWGGGGVDRSGSMRRTVWIAVVIWIVSVILATPDLVAAHTVYDSRINMTFCEAYPVDWPNWYPKFRVGFRFVALFALPLAIITTFYVAIAVTLLRRSRDQTGSLTSQWGEAAGRQLDSRRKVANAVLVFVLIFVVCWLPRHIYYVAWNFGTVYYNEFWHVFKAIGFILMFVSSAANPFALYVINDQFRRYFDHYLCGWCIKSRRLPGNYDRRRSTFTTTTSAGGQLVTTQQNISLDDLLDRYDGTRGGSTVTSTTPTAMAAPTTKTCRRL